MPNLLKLYFLTFLLSSTFLSCSHSEPLLANLEKMATIAVDRIKSEQHERGFWISLDTPDPVYTHKARKQPPLLPSTIIIDLLGPYAAENGLENEMQRARNYLAHQIEDNGLVRYFGRPDQSHIAPLRCAAISPDADDTSLAWRTAINPDRSLLPKTLKRLKAYRNEAGFYRTWLFNLVSKSCLVYPLLLGFSPFSIRDAIKLLVLLPAHSYFMWKYESKKHFFRKMLSS